MAIITFYEGFRIQLYKGVVEDSKLVYIIGLFISLLQPLSGYNSMEELVWMYSIFLILFCIALILNRYIGGVRITIYDATKKSLFSLIRSELATLSIQYEEKNGVDSEERVYLLKDVHAKAVVRWTKEGEGSDKLTLILKRWWKLYEGDEFKLRVIDHYRIERSKNNQVFWRPIILHFLFGLGILIFFISIYLRGY
ncbi:hypothetical protein EJF36_11650 [Bacillus sp. HMF5848]|uniref:hypothetical protein n=1 Tax=Bacillus sp. HMF5848 TaxID=2495421 RepID=UPI000F7B8A48|nr:hypothetical protein [Bacillus sp. HMF5848]RSK27484.1 hypothetical protein EJF36_11650 [Bacillus sp. HMF5848]